MTKQEISEKTETVSVEEEVIESLHSRKKLLTNEVESYDESIKFRKKWSFGWTILMVPTFTGFYYISVSSKNNLIFFLVLILLLILSLLGLITNFASNDNDKKKERFFISKFNCYGRPAICG